MSTVVLPYWLDEHGQRVSTRKCARPGCGREYLVRRYPYDTLRLIGWPLYRAARFTIWCGHGQELLHMPDEDGWIRFIPIVGTAR